MRINNNLMAMNTHRQLGINNNNSAKSIEKLSSGLRINRAGDDAAGLAISEKMRAQVRGLNQASRNAQDGISLIQTGEGALQETQAILQRMRELAVQSSSDTLVETDREKIQLEVDELATEITRISNNTEFNTQNLLNGGLTSDTTNGRDITFHIGANKGQDLTFGISAMDAETLGVAGDNTSGTVQAGATDVTGVTVTGSAAAVEDGNTITVSTALVSGSAAEKAAITGGSNFTSADLSSINADTSMSITVDGTTYTLDNAALTAWDNAGGHNAIGDVAAFLGAADNSGTALSTVADITNDGSKITITSKTDGTSSNVTINFTGTDAGTVAGVFGFSDGDTDTGADATSDTYTVTLSDSTNTDSVITGLTGTETSISGTGDFAGFTLTTDGTFDENLAATIDVASTQSTVAAIDADGNVTEAKVAKGIDVSTRTAANDAIKTINDAINTVSEERSKLGAYQNRLEHTIKNLDTSSENLQSAESRIRDVDMAKEMMEQSKNSILSQAAQAMLAQAKQAPQGVLQLLR